MGGSFETRLGNAPEEGVKAPCVIVTDAPITLAGEQTIDAINVVVGDRVCVAAQADPADNGIYDVKGEAWTRAKDFNEANDVITGVMVIDASSHDLHQASFTGSYNAGVTPVTFPLVLAAGGGDDTYTYDDVNAVDRTYTTRLWERASVLDFGAVADGVTSATVAIQNAINSRARVIYFPYTDTGVYATTDTIVIRTDKTLVFDEGVVIKKTVQHDPMFLNGVKGSSHAEYGANSYITIIGGIFNGNQAVLNTTTGKSMLAFGDATNIIIRGAKCIDHFGEAIQFVGIKDSQISDILIWNIDGNYLHDIAIAISEGSWDNSHFTHFNDANGDPCVNVSVDRVDVDNVNIAIGSHEIAE